MDPEDPKEKTMVLIVSLVTIAFLALAAYALNTFVFAEEVITFEQVLLIFVALSLAVGANSLVHY